MSRDDAQGRLVAGEGTLGLTGSLFAEEAVLDPGRGSVGGSAEGIAGLAAELLERRGQVEEGIDGRGEELGGHVGAALLDEGLTLEVLAQILDQPSTCLSGQDRAEGAVAVGALGVEVVGEALAALREPCRVKEPRWGGDLDRPHRVVAQVDEARR